MTNDRLRIDLLFLLFWWFVRWILKNYYTTLVTLLWCVHGSIGSPQPACHLLSWAYIWYLFSINQSCKTQNFTVQVINLLMYLNPMLKENSSLCFWSYTPLARPGAVTALDQAPVPGKAPTELLPPAPAPKLHSLTLSVS